MTAPEYIQLKAYARQDGFFLSLLWAASFACYILGMTNQLMGLTAVLLAVLTPFFVSSRLGRFREEGREGMISFSRSYLYVILVFFYGGVLLAVVQFLYFAYVDNGYLLGAFTKMLDSEENKQLLQQYGMEKAMDESLAEMASIRPIDYALNMLTVNIMLGFLLGIPIGLWGRRKEKISA